MESSKEITRKSKSNLAFAFGILPKDKRRDLTTFYAYCRSIDDLADDEGAAENIRQQALSEWKQGLMKGFNNPSALQREILELRDRCQIPTGLMVAIIEGCEMDLQRKRYQTWEELDAYIWKVACAVGLVCIRLFGCTSPQSEIYAEALGRALQLTNILRDVGEDFSRRGRIYLPLDELARFGYKEADLASKCHDTRFIELMKFQADRALDFFEQARTNLPAEDRKALKPARIMEDIYGLLLLRMRSDNFRVFEHRYRVGKLGKLFIGLRHLFA